MSERHHLSLAHSGSHKSYEAIVKQALKNHDAREDISEKTYTVQQAIDSMGFGKFQIKISIMAGLCYMADAMEIMLMSLLAPILKCTFQLTSLQEAFLTTSVFLGMCLSANIWGILADNYGRKPILLMFATFSGYFGILSSLSPNYWWILGLRFVVGCGLGATPQAMTYYVEFLPTKARSSCILAIAIMWAVGSCLQAALALLIVPTLGWRWLLGLSSIPLLSFTAIYKFLPESPRYYIHRGYSQQAYQTLSKMAKDNNHHMPSGKLQREASQSKTPISNWKDLFLPEHLRISVMAAIMYLSGNSAYYGTSILTTSLFENVDGCHGYDSSQSKGNDTCNAFCQTLSTDDYLDFMITSLSELPGIFIAMFLLNHFGRRTVLTAMYFTFSLMIFLCNICLPRTALVALLFVARALGSGVSQGNYLYTAELFPTSIRATGLGWCSSVSRIGMILTPFLAQVLIKVSPYLPISGFGFLGFVGGVATILIPVETANMEMH